MDDDFIHAGAGHWAVLSASVWLLVQSPGGRERERQGLSVGGPLSNDDNERNGQNAIWNPFDRIA